MRLGSGVEWGLHCCLLLAWLEGESVPVARLAEYHDLPAAYLNKQMQALARAGIVRSGPGAKGGFVLARPPEMITLLDVVVAIEGREDAFRCTEIRRSGPERGVISDHTAPCTIATAMRKAELAWRRSLAEQTLADILAATQEKAGAPASRARRWFARQPPENPGSNTPSTRGD